MSTWSPPVDPYVKTQKQSDSTFLEDSEQSLFRGPSHKSKAASSDNRLTYYDEDFNYYPSQSSKQVDESQDASLVHNAVDVGRSGNYQDLGAFWDDAR